MEIIWNLRHEQVGVWNQLVEGHPEIQSHFQATSEKLPLASALDPFDDGVFLRPARHMRAYYQRIGASGVFAIKGTEINHQDIQNKFELLQNIRVDYPSRGRSLFSVLEHFPIVEQKIPMAVTIGECMEDVESSLLLQRLHLNKFGVLAHAPVPLFVARWDQDITDVFLDRLNPLLSKRAADIVKLVAIGGLGIIVYFYPCIPIRVAHLDLEFTLSAGFQARQIELSKRLDPNEVINRWMDNAVKMLVLGLMPGSRESIGVGHCLEAQNAVIDGGFVDLGSTKPFGDIQSEQEFTETITAMVLDLSKTIRRFMLGSEVDTSAEYRNPSIAMANTVGRVWSDVLVRLKSYASNYELDNRLKSILNEKDLYSGLSQSYEQLFPDQSVKSSHNKKNSTGTALN